LVIIVTKKLEIIFCNCNFVWLLGVVKVYFEKPKFESRLTFALDDGAGGDEMSGALSLAAQFGLSIGGGQSMFSGIILSKSF
jgi:hypothetical protein